MTLTGQAAYEFLLRFACGLESQNAGEYFVLQDLKSSWSNYRDKHPTDAKPLTKTVESILADAKTVRSHIFGGNLHSTRYEISALTIAGVKKSDHVLLVADNNSITKKVARALGRSAAQRAGSISVTHPNSQALQNRFKELTMLKEQKFIDCPIAPVSFDEALRTGFNEANHVFVCTPMLDTLEQAHTNIVDAWMRRSRSDGNLVVLQQIKKETIPAKLWLGTSLQNCILSDAVQTQFQKDIEYNQRLLEKAARGCRNAAAARATGLTSGKVSEVIVKHIEDNYADVCGHIASLEQRSTHRPAINLSNSCQSVCRLA